MNLLINPSFEGEYIEWGAGEVKVAPSWAPIYVNGRMGKPGIGITGGSAEGMDFARPEYKPLGAPYLYRVRSGARSQCWFSFYRVHYAGITQGVSMVEPGRWYQLSVYGQSWCWNDDTILKSADMFISLGLGPAGEISLEDRGIVWAPWAWVPGPKGEQQSTANWTLFKSRVVQAQADSLSVWIITSPKWSLKHADVYVDDASLDEVEIGATPEPEPEPEPEPQPGEAVDYAQIRAIIRDELDHTRLVR